MKPQQKSTKLTDSLPLITIWLQFLQAEVFTKAVAAQSLVGEGAGSRPKYLPGAKESLMGRFLAAGTLAGEAVEGSFLFLRRGIQLHVELIAAVPLRRRGRA
ncbi:hypothetical protein [Bradyrhizobium sp. USDA 3256]